MTDVCMYMQVHQPYRLRRYRVFDIGTGAPYWDDATNHGVLRRVADRCYVPTNTILAEQIRRSDGAFRVAMSCSGVLLEQLETGAPDVIDSFRDLVATGGVELLGETYYHSVTSLSNLDEFTTQVRAHTAMVERLFGVTPRVFRNTELLYHDGLAGQIAGMGFRGVLVEGADHILHGRTPNTVYAAVGDSGLRLLPRNYRLSDDVAFRFSQRSWNEWPLTADRYASWLAGVGAGSAHIFIDYETFGEHQWAETGIFDFIRHLPNECLRRGVRFVHPSQLAARDPTDTLGVPWATSWADTERDASAWLGNRLQQAAFNRLNRLYEPICATGDGVFLDSWRRLSTSDHLYYMSTKRLADAEVHSYFNPYANPYDAFVAYMNVLQDLEQRVDAVGAAVGARGRVVELVSAERAPTQPVTAAPMAAAAMAATEQPLVWPRKAKTQHATSGGAKGGDAKGRSADARSADTRSADGRGAEGRSARRRPAKRPSEA
jgi:alpha-amylase